MCYVRNDCALKQEQPQKIHLVWVKSKCTAVFLLHISVKQPQVTTNPGLCGEENRAVGKHRRPWATFHLPERDQVVGTPECISLPSSR